MPNRSHPRGVCLAASIVPLIALASFTLAAGAGGVAGYDPMAVAPDVTPKTVDLVIRDEARQRDIPIRMYLPVQRSAGERQSAAPVVLFSHGLGGSRENNQYLGVHWAARGYVGVFLQHPGSDESVWKNAEQGARYRTLRGAANGQNLRLRTQDVRAVLDRLEQWNKAGSQQPAGVQLAGRLDLTRVGMSGHSFGAVTTQAVSGQTFPGLGAAVRMGEPRIKASVIFSPSSPRIGDPRNAFGSVKVPWLLMTGTDDTSPIGDIDLESRLAVFPSLPPGDKFELVLDGATHSAFGDRPLPGDREGQRNPNHHRAIVAISTAFWDTYLRSDPAARAWLNGEGPASVLQKADRWQHK